MPVLWLRFARALFTRIELKAKETRTVEGHILGAGGLMERYKR